MTIDELRGMIHPAHPRARQIFRLLARTEVDPRYLAESPLLGGEFEDIASIGMVLAVESNGALTVLDQMNRLPGHAVIRRRMPDCRFGPVCRTNEGTWFLLRQTDRGPFDGFRRRFNAIIEAAEEAIIRQAEDGYDEPRDDERRLPPPASGPLADPGYIAECVHDAGGGL